MITETREIYRCEYCKKIYLRKHFCESHELKCKKNPKNYSPCLDGCEHIDKKNFTYFFDTWQGEDNKIVSVLYCTKKEIAICPFWHSPYEYLTDCDGEEILNIEMPKNCQCYSKSNLMKGIL